jgi:HEPN domain-containing protein
MLDHEYWFHLAEEEWTVVQNELSAEKKVWRVVCFQSHATAEKYLKGFLALHKILPDKTHSLFSLLDQCESFDSSLASLSSDCNRLDFFAIDARYPRDHDKYDEKSARLAVTAAETIRNAILKRISEQA